MRTLVFVTCVALAGTARAQYPQQPQAPPPLPQPTYPQYPEATPPQPPPEQPQVYAPPADDSDDDGVDIDYDVYYDDAAAQNYDDGYDPNASQQFESTLSPYGQWIDTPTYGRVWVPSENVVGSDFTPYGTNGNWDETEYGWTWVSGYDWGWAPFHYGRWTNVGGYGWGWIPGTTWGPAWVSWRCGGGYAGWAPLPPPGVTVGPPRGARSPWRFVVASSLGSLHPAVLPSRVIPSVFARTSVVTNLRTLPAAGGLAVRINAGPALHLAGAPAIRPLRTVAPQALPRVAITPRVGQPVASRPWVQARAAGSSLAPRASLVAPRPMPITMPRSIAVTPRPIGLSRPLSSAPMPRSVPIYTPPRYGTPHYTSQYSAPVYRAPSYEPHYSTPVSSAPHYSAPPSYSAPHYSAPSYSEPHYSAPSYSAPHYSAPSYSAPHYSAPSAPAHFSAPSHMGGGRR